MSSILPPSGDAPETGGAPNVIDNDDNLIVGDEQPNSFDGLGGNDTIQGLGANDTLLGDAGNDSIEGGEGDDSIEGGAGNDYLAGGTGNDVIKGNSANDTIYGGAGNDTMFGGNGSDVAVFDGDLAEYSFRRNYGQTEVMRGGETDIIQNFDLLEFDDQSIPRPEFTPLSDAFTGSFADDTLEGGAGDDTIDGLSGDDSISGGIGNDELTGGEGDDTLDGGEGEDQVILEGPFEDYSFSRITGAILANGARRPMKSGMWRSSASMTGPSPVRN